MRGRNRGKRKEEHPPFTICSRVCTKEKVYMVWSCDSHVTKLTNLMFFFFFLPTLCPTPWPGSASPVAS